MYGLTTFYRAVTCTLLLTEDIIQHYISVFQWYMYMYIILWVKTTAFSHPSSLQSYSMKRFHLPQGTRLDRLVGGVLDGGSDDHNLSKHATDSPLALGTLYTTNKVCIYLTSTIGSIIHFLYLSYIIVYV